MKISEKQLLIIFWSLPGELCSHPEKAKQMAMRKITAGMGFLVKESQHTKWAF